jgi:hypothetical protein
MRCARWIRKRYPARARLFYDVGGDAGPVVAGTDADESATAACGKVSVVSGTDNQFTGPGVLVIGKTGFTTVELEAPTLPDGVAVNAGAWSGN